MYFLKQSLATTFKAGPFVDKNDGETPLPSLTIVQADIRLSKNGGNFVQTADASGASYDENGWYDVPIHATDVNNTGRLRISIKKAGALFVWQDFMVLPALVYDSLIIGDDNLQVDMLQVGGSSVSQTRLKDLVDTGYDSVTHKIQGVVLNDTTTVNTDIIDVSRVINNIAAFGRHGKGIAWPLAVPYYWDPVNGNDSNDGILPTAAKLTYAAALGLCTAYHHDSITLVNSTGGALVVDIKVDINVVGIHLIGDGNTTLKPTSSGAATVILSGVDCHFEGLMAETHTTGNENAIEVTADRCEVHEFDVPYSRANAVVLDGANGCTIHNFRLTDPGVGGNGHGVQITGASERNRIHDFCIAGASGDGINLNGGGVSENIISSGDGGSIIHECSGWGIREQGGADDNEIIGPNFLVEDNTEGNFSLGANTVNRNTSQFAEESALNTHDTDIKSNISTLSGDLVTHDNKIGTPVALDGGAGSVSGMLTKMADDNGGANFDAETDSLKKGFAGGGGSLTAQQVWEYAARTITEKTGFSLSTSGIKAIWDQLTSALSTVGSIGKLLVDNINAAISSRASSAALITHDTDIKAGITVLNTKLGTPIALAGGTVSLAGMINQLADNEDGDFDNGESLHDIAAVGGTGITKQQVRDSMQLSPSVEESTDDSLDGKISRLVGLNFENTHHHSFVYVDKVDTDGTSRKVLASQELDVYDSPENATDLDGIIGLLFSYTLTFTSDIFGNLTSMIVVRSDG